MLDIKKISLVPVFDEDWLKVKLGMISASNFGLLVGKDIDKGKLSQKGITYIEGLVGERLTGEPAQDEFFNDDIEHGNSTEPEGINFSKNEVGFNILRNENGSTGKLIINDEYSCCTPDALLYKGDNPFDNSGNFLNVTPLEVKCPARHHRFIKLFRCNTPLDLKRTEAKYYWQVIMQMISCGSIEAFFGCYNPAFKVKGKVIKFKQTELIDDVKIYHKALKSGVTEIKSLMILLNGK